MPVKFDRRPSGTGEIMMMASIRRSVRSRTCRRLRHRRRRLRVVPDRFKQSGCHGPWSCSEQRLKTTSCTSWSSSGLAHAPSSQNDFSENATPQWNFIRTANEFRSSRSSGAGGSDTSFTYHQVVIIPGDNLSDGVEAPWWSVFLATNEAPPGTDQQTGADEELAFAFLEALNGAHACVGVGTIDHDATIAVQALDVGSATVQALGLFCQAVQTAGLSPRPISQLEVTRWDVFERGAGAWSQEDAAD